MGNNKVMVWGNAYSREIKEKLEVKWPGNDKVMVWENAYSREIKEKLEVKWWKQVDLVSPANPPKKTKNNSSSNNNKKDGKVGDGKKTGADFSKDNHTKKPKEIEAKGREDGKKAGGKGGDGKICKLNETNQREGEKKVRGGGSDSKKHQGNEAKREKGEGEKKKGGGGGKDGNALVVKKVIKDAETGKKVDLVYPANPPKKSNVIINNYFIKDCNVIINNKKDGEVGSHRKTGAHFSKDNDTKKPKKM